MPDPVTEIVWDDRTLQEYDLLLAAIRTVNHLQSANRFLDNVRTLMEVVAKLEPVWNDEGGLLGQLKVGNRHAWDEIIEIKRGAGS